MTESASPSTNLQPASEHTSSILQGFDLRVEQHQRAATEITSRGNLYPAGADDRTEPELIIVLVFSAQTNDQRNSAAGPQLDFSFAAS